MDARGVHGGADVHAVVEDVGDDLENGGDDARAAAGAGDHHHVVGGVENDRRCHCGEHALAGLDRVCFALHEAEHVRCPGLRCEIVHLVVEQETAAAHRYCG